MKSPLRNPSRLKGVQRLLKVVARLRGRGGCPWDRKQTLRSLQSGLLEETYELVDAIRRKNPQRHAEELGDVLLHLVLQAQIRAEQGRFTFDDVAGRLADKLVRRHPHVFGGARVRTSREVLRQWERIKASERGGRRTACDGVAAMGPALLRAQRVQERAARVGFDWSRPDEVAAKVEEELREWRRARKAGYARAREELGDVLFAIVNLCRWHRVNAEDALREATDKFERRLRRIERRLSRRGIALHDCSPAKLDAEWNEVKKAERRTARRRRAWRTPPRHTPRRRDGAEGGDAARQRG